MKQNKNAEKHVAFRINGELYEDFKLICALRREMHTAMIRVLVQQFVDDNRADLKRAKRVFNV